MGESWHNLHHADPTCARHGVGRGQIDISARIIAILERLGWAYDIRWPTPAARPPGRVPRPAGLMTSRPRGTQGDPVDDVRSLVPRVLRVTAALGWRLLVVIAAIYVLGIVVSRLAAVVVPVAVAVLLAALLSPAVQALHRRGVPQAAAAALVLVGGLAASAGC